jgi:hypothetical protein
VRASERRMEDTVFHQLFAALQDMDAAKLRGTDANERPWTVAFQVLLIPRRCLSQTLPLTC